MIEAQTRSLCWQTPVAEPLTLHERDPTLPLDLTTLVLPPSATQLEAGFTPLVHAVRTAPAAQLKKLLRARLSVPLAADTLRSELNLALLLGLWVEPTRSVQSDASPLAVLMEEPAVRSAAAASCSADEQCDRWFLAIHAFARLRDPQYSPVGRPELDPVTWLLRSGLLDLGALMLTHAQSRLSPLQYLQTKLELKYVQNWSYKERPSEEQVERDRKTVQEQSKVITEQMRALLRTCLRSNLTELCAAVSSTRDQTGLQSDLLRLVVGYLAPINAIAPDFQFAF